MAPAPLRLIFLLNEDMSTIPITKRGAELLKEELQRLKAVERPAVINAISEARAQGDLSENAEYDAAKEKQAFIEGRILEVEAKLSAAHAARAVCTNPRASPITRNSTAPAYPARTQVPSPVQK